MSDRKLGDVRSIHMSRTQIQYGWDRDRKPLVTVASGSNLTLEVSDAGGGQFNSGSTAADVAALDFDRVNPTCGPIFVEGAEVGTVLQIEILNLRMGSFGWTGIIPGFGLLADQFTTPWLNIWAMRGGMAEFRDGIRVPLQPFCGVMGLALAEAGTHSVVPPRRVGGNLDIKQLTQGSSLFLPVEVDGALLGIGDTHGAQGDGEVCGTAIESPMEVEVRLTVRRDLDLDAPEFDVLGPLERPAAAAAGYHATTGVAPDLMRAARQAIERMIGHLSKHYRLAPEEAYALCSVAVDLKISEVVDAPNWVVSAFLPKDLFD